ncbi:hypothetical protein [Micromonospora aurantiaca (nom. illeg.)]|uniref:hypothetical protein n=1 Tax=Micromonospora aurantiaca (nom. illeg.) TaxID=47850 RepID=UPI0034157959
MAVRVTGSAQLHTVRQALRDVGDRGLGGQLRRGLKAAGDKLAPAVRAEVPRAMPSGYAPTLSRSLRFRTVTRETRHTAWVTVRVYGDGRKEKRDVPRLNAGVLRHPVFGRSRPLKNHARYKATSQLNPWVAQTVRKGFVDRPADRLMPEVSREMQRVVDWVASQITKG